VASSFGFVLDSKSEIHPVCRATPRAFAPPRDPQGATTKQSLGPRVVVSTATALDAFVRLTFVRFAWCEV